MGETNVRIVFGNFLCVLQTFCNRTSVVTAQLHSHHSPSYTLMLVYESRVVADSQCYWRTISTQTFCSIFWGKNSAKTVNENSSDALWIPNPLRVISVIGQRTSCCKFSFGPKDPLNERNLEAAKFFVRQTAESSRSNGPNNVTSLIIGKSKALAMRCGYDVVAMWLRCGYDVAAMWLLPHTPRAVSSDAAEPIAADQLLN